MVHVRRCLVFVFSSLLDLNEFTHSKRHNTNYRCFGSLVCSAYASKFADTGIKFIFDPSGVGASTGGMAAVDVPRNPSCEAKARTFFDVTAHATPGVDVETSLYTDGRCPLWDPKMHMVDVEDALDKHPVDFKVTGRQKSGGERNVGRRVDEY